MKLPKLKNKVPVIILIIAIFMIFSVTGLPSLLKMDPISNNLFYQIFFSLVELISIISGIGLIAMKKWAVKLYTGNVLISLIFSFSIGMWNPVSLLISMTILVIIMSFYGKMK